MADPEADLRNDPEFDMDEFLILEEYVVEVLGER